MVFCKPTVQGALEVRARSTRAFTTSLGQDAEILGKLEKNGSGIADVYINMYNAWNVEAIFDSRSEAEPAECGG